MELLIPIWPPVDAHPSDPSSVGSQKMSMERSPARWSPGLRRSNGNVQRDRAVLTVACWVAEPDSEKIPSTGCPTGGPMGFEIGCPMGRPVGGEIGCPIIGGPNGGRVGCPIGLAQPLQRNIMFITNTKIVFGMFPPMSTLVSLFIPVSH